MENSNLLLDNLLNRMVTTIVFIASGESVYELKHAQEFINNCQGIDKVFLNPVNSGFMGITWITDILPHLKK